MQAAQPAMSSVEQHLAADPADRPAGPVLRPRLLDAQGCVLARTSPPTASCPASPTARWTGMPCTRPTSPAPAPSRRCVLPVVGDIAAGNTNALSLGPGQTMRIMTGAPLPPGADAVVPVERTDGGVVRGRLIDGRPGAGPARAAERRGRRSAGDVRPARPAPCSGPAQIALLAAAGRPGAGRARGPASWCSPPATSSSSRARARASARSSTPTSFMLTAAVRDVGAIAVPGRRGRPTTPATLHGDPRGPAGPRRRRSSPPAGSAWAPSTPSRRCSRASAPCSSTRSRCARACRRASGCSARSRCRCFTLPGNPVSALVSFHVFVAPGAARHGRRAPRRSYPPGFVPAVAGGVARARSPGKMEFLRRASLDGDRARLAGGQGSHMLGALAAADALAVIPPEVVRGRSRATSVDVPAAARRRTAP